MPGSLRRHQFVMDDYDGDCAACGEGLLWHIESGSDGLMPATDLLGMTPEQMRWYVRGAEDEAACRNEDMSARQCEVRDAYETLCRTGWWDSALMVLAMTAHIFLAGTSLRDRLRFLRVALWGDR